MVGIPLVVGVAKDTDYGVDSPDRAIRSRTYIGEGTGDLDPGVGVIARKAKDVANGVDSPDIGTRSGGDSFERTGNFNPVSGIPSIARDVADGVDPQTVPSAAALMSVRPPGVAVIAYVTKYVGTRVDSLDVGDRPSRNSCEMAGDLFPRHFES